MVDRNFFVRYDKFKIFPQGFSLEILMDSIDESIHSTDIVERFRFLLKRNKKPMESEVSL